MSYMKWIAELIESERLQILKDAYDEAIALRQHEVFFENTVISTDTAYNILNYVKKHQHSGGAPDDSAYFEARKSDC